MSQTSVSEVNQKISKTLGDFVSEISPYFDQFFKKQKSIAKSISPEAFDMVERLETFIGGKRVRGYLTKFGYEIFNGKPTSDIYKAAQVSELIQALALIHDDIMDNDNVRRGSPTIHTQYKKIHDEKYKGNGKDRDLYGNSMAILLGDLAPFYSNIIMADTNFPSELKMKFLKRASEVFVQTIYGQGMDITYEQLHTPKEELVMKIHKYKTSYYTIAGPLQYGALLAGASENDERYKAIENYGVPVGIAFQLKDDEMGMFSKQAKFGKPIFSDLKEGKNTVLFSKAFENANEEQLKFLKSVHGNPDVKEEDLEKVNTILIDTGAVKYSQELCAELLKKGKTAISRITDNVEQAAFLEMFADFVAARNK